MQSWWERHVVSRMIRCGCSQEMLTDLRRQVVPLAEGNVLELGVGAGANLPLYEPSKVTSLVGIDPSGELLEYARRECAGNTIACSLLQATGEDLPFEEAHFDTAVVTFTLCSVHDPQLVLAEARRVLKPNGKLLFLEHAASPDAGPRRWQGRIEPVWKRLTGNCHLTRSAIAHVARSGLKMNEEHGFYIPGKPRIVSWFEWGVASKL